jgi:hypothetical protein
MFATLATADGRLPVDAAMFALGMRRRILDGTLDAMRAIEVSGGGAGGRE